MVSFAEIRSNANLIFLCNVLLLCFQIFIDLIQSDGLWAIAFQLIFGYLYYSRKLTATKQPLYYEVRHPKKANH